MLFAHGPEPLYFVCSLTCLGLPAFFTLGYGLRQLGDEGNRPLGFGLLAISLVFWILLLVFTPWPQ